VGLGVGVVDRLEGETRVIGGVGVVGWGGARGQCTPT